MAAHYLHIGPAPEPRARKAEEANAHPGVGERGTERQ
jgi:hypothetical protein